VRASADTRPTATTCRGAIPADIQIPHRMAEFRFEISFTSLPAGGTHKTEHLLLPAFDP
jgi:hypothetical protein